MNLIKFTEYPEVLDYSPINPTWILEGKPKASSKKLSETEDGASVTMMWSCTKGKFNWFYECDEIVHIIKGEVTIKDHATGVYTTLSVGSSILFPKGSRAEWTVKEYVRKVAVLYTPLPKKLILARRAIRSIRSLVRPQKIQVFGGL